MTPKKWLLPLAGLTAGLLISGRLVLLAQDRAATARPGPIPSPRESSDLTPRAAPDQVRPDEREAVNPSSRGSTGAATLQDALLRPYRFPFARPTPWRKSAST